MARRDRIEALQADIEAGVADLVAGEGWQRWLSVAARFPRYSFRNQLLILTQRPDASVVMGYRAWQGFVLAAEHGLLWLPFVLVAGIAVGVWLLVHRSRQATDAVD